MRMLFEGLGREMAAHLATIYSMKGYTVYIDNYGWHKDILATDEITGQEGKIKVRDIEPNLGS